ncbi:MAG: DUF89 domain-containing protein [Candidatus Hodarchaeota archaeon]
MRFECLYCLFHRAERQIERLTTNEELRFRALAGVIRIIANHVDPSGSENISHPLRLCPSYIGTKRDRFLQTFFQVVDIYKKEKSETKAQTLYLWRMIQNEMKSLSNLQKQLNKALALATAANIIEYDLLTQKREPNINQKIEFVFNFAEKEWDDLSYELIPNFLSNIKSANKILYLTDNIGETVFDAKVIDILLHLGKDIIIAGKSKPILNDATYLDLRELWDKINCKNDLKIISIGTNSVGLLLDEVSDEFQEAMSKCDLIIAKGMGHFETLPEYDWNQAVWCLFRTKCNPVAMEANSILGKNCIRKIA